MLKKSLFSVLFTVLAMAGMSAAATITPVIPNKDGDNCYLISDAQELYGFAAIVNGTNGNTAEPTACGVLTADIVVNEHVLDNGQGTKCVSSAGSYNVCDDAFRNNLYTWTPIGIYTDQEHFRPFSGSFDGHGHTISGLYYGNQEKNIGLFGYVSGNGVNVSIKNVGIEDSYFRVDSYAGGIVGIVNSGSGVLNIENVYNGSVFYIKGQGEVGGLVGYVKDWTLNITNAYNSGSIFGTSGTTTYSYVAGLVGYISSTATVNIKNAFNNGNLNGYAPLVNSNAKTVQNSFYLGETLGSYGVAKSSNEFSNGSVFAALRSSEEGSVWHQYQGEAYPTFVEKTGETPFVAHSAILHYSTTVSESIYFVEGAAVSLPTVDKSGNAILGWYANSGFTGTKYTEIPASANSDLTLYPKLFQLVDGCYEISDADMLYAFASIVNNDVNAKACGKLTADIVVNQNVLANVNTDGSLKDGVNFKQWIPIGNSTNKFQGSFDGQGHTISGLYFNDSGMDNVGLFGCVFGEPESITIENVGLVDSYFRGKNSVGGLVGNAYGLLTIKNSFNASSVNASEGNFGGLVGYSLKGSADLVNLTISNSYNVGSLNGASHGGGLVGSAVELTISNSYNTGSVSVNGSGKEIYVGGFAASAEKVTITNSYNFGSISSPNGVLKDDFVSYYTETNSTVTNSFYIGTCKFEGNGATKKTSDEFANGTVFAALHSAEDGEVWRQYKNDAYPTFAAKTGTDAPAPMHVVVLHYSETDSVAIAYTQGETLTLPTVDREDNAIAGWTTSADGTGAAITEIPTTATTDLKLYPKEFVPDAEGYYEIATADDLYKFAEIVNNGTAVGSGTELGVKAKLIADICVNACGEGESVLKADGTLNGDGSNFIPWTPIGMYEESASHPFIGTFDGQGHTISGLYFNDHDGGLNVGLFGYIGSIEEPVSETVSIRNVGIEDSYFNAQSAVGGVVGFVENAALDMENVYNAAVVVGASYVGGVVGYVSFYNPLTLNMVNVYNVGSVNCEDDEQAGGLVGYFADAEDTKITIKNSYNYGTVGGGNSLVGTVESEYEDAVTVTNSFYLGSSGSGVYGESKSATEFADGTVLIALRSGEGGNVWVQNLGDIYPTININGSTNPYTLVLDWQSANDQVKLQDSLSKYSESIQNQISSTDVNVIVKEGKQFYADGKIYRGNIPTEDVSDICNNNKTLYPISGVELETDDKGLLVAILDGMDREEGDTAPAIMIPFDLTVDKVIYKREMTAGIYKTVMLPFNVANLKLDAYSNYGFYRFTSMDENVDGYRYMAMVYRVRLLQANMPYIMKNIGETDTEGIVFEGDGRITLNTVSSGSREFSATSNDSITWSMKGVYENKVWETGDPEIGSAYLFAGQKKDGYKIGEYAKLGAGASLQPMRMYLLKGALAQLNRPGMFGSVDHYGSPESIGVRFVDDEEFDEGEETMVEKRITVIPTVIKSNRWFDMKGRALDSKPTAKGNYYYNGKRITIK